MEDPIINIDDFDAPETVDLRKDDTSQRVQVTAKSGVTAVWGIHHYLKYYTNAHFSWDTVRTGKDSFISPDAKLNMYRLISE